MPRKPSGNFDQNAYIHEWTRQNMKRINVSYSAKFVDEFREACDYLKLSQSQVVKKAMQEVIDAYHQAKKSPDQ